MHAQKQRKLLRFTPLVKRLGSKTLAKYQGAYVAYTRDQKVVGEQ